MKRTYIKPAVEILDIETKATCAATSWHVSGKNTNSETDSGWVIEEKENGEYPDNYNPWDSENW
jgi:hypothetical protein